MNDCMFFDISFFLNLFSDELRGLKAVVLCSIWTKWWCGLYFFLCFVLFCSPSFIDLLSNRDNFPVTKKKRKRKKNIMMIILLDGWRKKPARPCLCYLYYIVLCNIMTKYCHYRYMVLVLKEIKKIFWPSIIWNLLQTWRKRRKKIIHSFGGVWIENRLKIYWIPKVQDEWSKCERMNEWRKNLTIAKQQQMLIIWLNQQTLLFCWNDYFSSWSIIGHHTRITTINWTLLLYMIGICFQFQCHPIILT